MREPRYGPNLCADGEADDEGQGEVGVQVSLDPVLVGGDDRRGKHDEQARGYRGQDVEPEEDGEERNEHRSATDPERARCPLRPGARPWRRERNGPRPTQLPPEGESDVLARLAPEHGRDRVEEEDPERDGEPLRGNPTAGEAVRNEAPTTVAGMRRRPACS